MRVFSLIKEQIIVNQPIAFDGDRIANAKPAPMHEKCKECEAESPDSGILSNLWAGKYRLHWTILSNSSRVKYSLGVWLTEMRPGFVVGILCDPAGPIAS